MFSPRKSFLSLLLLLPLFAIQPPVQALAQGSGGKSSKAPEARKTGFVGDPARKRGIEIGYDLGKKAGKVDLEQKLKPDPKRHEAFNKPEKYFRSEYGSQASFVSGFKSGFLGGYQAGQGKKVPLSATGLSGDKTKATTGAPVKQPSAGTASDAL